MWTLVKEYRVWWCWWHNCTERNGFVSRGKRVWKEASGWISGAERTMILLKSGGSQRRACKYLVVEYSTSWPPARARNRRVGARCFYRGISTPADFEVPCSLFATTSPSLLSLRSSTSVYSNLSNIFQIICLCALHHSPPPPPPPLFTIHHCFFIVFFFLSTKCFVRRIYIKD